MKLGNGITGVISVFGLINDVRLPFLLDTGASHNFLSLRDAEALGLSLRNGDIGMVTLANGEQLTCDAYVECLVSFGGTQQLVRMEVLKCDIKPILGVPFFATVNPVIDWTKRVVTCRKGSRTMKFDVVPVADVEPVEEVSLR